ncbi:MAG: hypothetical protein ACJAT2_002753 [Bacteriovoracaceae bacterium]|jgi:hypothetical protein
MKRSLLITICLLFSTNAFAKDLASYRFAVREDVAGKSIIHSLVATVTDEAELNITHNTASGTFPFFMDEQSEGEGSFSKKLNKHIFSLLKRDIIRLSEAEIERRTNQIVCMMMPGPTMSNNHLSVLRGYDYRSDSFTGVMELVDGPSGCWVSSATYPKNTYDRAAATSLKGLIKAITLDSIGSDL